MEDVLAEYESCRIGPVIVAKTTAAARRLTRRYPAAVYSPNRRSWSPDAIEELVHDFVTDDLHLARQIDYLVLQTSERRFEALLTTRLRWYIFDRGARTHADRLRDRSRRVLEGPGFRRRAAGRDVLYSPADREVARRRPTDQEIAAAMAAVRRVPRVESHATERLSPVYTHERLTQALELIADCLPCEFTSWDVHRIFREVLTWTGTATVDIGDDDSMRSARAIGGQDEMVVRETVRQLLAKLDDRQRRLLSLKLRETSDELIGHELGVSRQTIAKWKLPVFAIVGQELEGMSHELQEAALVRLGDVIDGGSVDG
jgi:hypothetical protein